MRALSAFGWFGSKYSHLPWLSTLLPAPAKIEHFVEPYCGSAAVLLNRQRSALETINDLDDEVVNFFRVLRERELELTRAVMLSPYSRSEYKLAQERPDPDQPFTPEAALERARRFLIRTSQSFGCQGKANTGWARRVIADGRGGDAFTWARAASRLHAVAERLTAVQIECKPALALIKEFDQPKAFFYCDPPYAWNSRARGTKRYAHEMCNQDHSQLAELLNVCRGRVAVSGYWTSFQAALYPAPKWTLIECERVGRSVQNTALRRECLWVNYEVEEGVQFNNANSSHALTHRLAGERGAGPDSHLVLEIDGSGNRDPTETDISRGTGACRSLPAFDGDDSKREHRSNRDRGREVDPHRPIRQPSGIPAKHSRVTLPSNIIDAESRQ